LGKEDGGGAIEKVDAFRTGWGSASARTHLKLRCRLLAGALALGQADGSEEDDGDEAHAELKELQLCSSACRPRGRPALRASS
jgi:L-aminopeptidase/D-esterase-like protein